MATNQILGVIAASCLLWLAVENVPPYKVMVKNDKLIILNAGHY